MISFSKRSETGAAPNAFSEALASARAEGTPLLDLSSGNPTEQGLGLSDEQIARALSQPGLERYEPLPFGSWAARSFLAELLAKDGFALSPQQIMLTASTSEAYGYLFKLLCDRDDVVLVPEPSYPLLDVLAQLEGVRLSRYALDYDGEWHVDRDSLARARNTHGARVRAIACVQPNNPTGSFLKPDELALLAAQGVPLISDEVFGDYALAPAAGSQSALGVAESTLVFRLSGLSKQLALPQLKLAYTAIAGPEALVTEACARLEHIADAYLSPASSVQLALPALFAHKQALQASIVQRVRDNHAELAHRLDGSCASVLRIEGGWYAVVRLPNVQTDERFCLELLREALVIAQPGYFFDLPEAHLVLSLVVRRELFAEGVARLRAVLDRIA